jgi:hypothetical protein
MSEISEEAQTYQSSLVEFFNEPPKGFMPAMYGLLAVELGTKAINALDIIDRTTTTRLSLGEVAVAISFTAGAYIGSRNQESDNA